MPVHGRPDASSTPPLGSQRALQTPKSRASSDKLPITVLIQTKNEAASIAKCIEGLRDFDEVLVVDSDSTDGTPAIARSLDVKVVNFTWNGLYPKKKQWQLEHVETRNPWVLLLDADEAPDRLLKDSLRALFAADPEPREAAFQLRLGYVFAGRLLQHGHRVVKVTLLHRDRAHFPAIDDLDAPGMGELEGHYQPITRGRVGRVDGLLLHNDIDPVRTWFDRHNRYSDWESYLQFTASKSADKHRSLQGRIFAKVPFKPLAFFSYAYIAKAGFLDGRAGFDYAVALATYYWQIGVKVRELQRIESSDG